MEVREVTATLREKLEAPTRRDVEFYFGEADKQDVQLALSDPLAFAKAAGVKTTEESQYSVSVRKRQDRHDLAGDRSARRARRPIIIVIHYECCCGDILVLGW